MYAYSLNLVECRVMTINANCYIFLYQAGLPSNIVIPSPIMHVQFVEYVHGIIIAIYTYTFESFFVELGIVINR